MIKVKDPKSVLESPYVEELMEIDGAQYYDERFRWRKYWH